MRRPVACVRRGRAVAALTLGLYARKRLAGRMERNSAFDHAGNVAIALAAGAVGYVFSQRAVSPSGGAISHITRLEAERLRSVSVSRNSAS